MPLPNTGAISLSDIQTEFGGSNPISLNEYYKGGAYVSNNDTAPNVPTSGQISVSNFYGAAKVNSPSTVEYLVVGGGGPGMGSASFREFWYPGKLGPIYIYNWIQGAGGGAGGYRTATGLAVSAGTTYPVTVGAGGAGGSWLNPPGFSSNAPSSTFSNITSTGGGTGGFSNNNGSPYNAWYGGPGGSGGGGAAIYQDQAGIPVVTRGLGGTGTSGQGTNGAEGSASGEASGGGGGSANAGSGINGGNGTASSITGTSVTRGGGGGGGTANSTTGGTGGSGGGANGIGANNNNNVTLTSPSGSANTGGGGGGAVSPRYQFYFGAAGLYNTGGAGGSGIVVIRYPNSFSAASTTTGSPTFTDSGGYKVYVFNGSGSIRW